MYFPLAHVVPRNVWTPSLSPLSVSPAARPASTTNPALFKAPAGSDQTHRHNRCRRSLLSTGMQQQVPFVEFHTSGTVRAQRHMAAHIPKVLNQERSVPCSFSFYYRLKTEPRVEEQLVCWSSAKQQMFQWVCHSLAFKHVLQSNAMQS